MDSLLPDVTLAPLLVGGPLVAALVLPPRRVALIGLVALLVVLPLGAADHIWGKVGQAWIAAAVVAASVIGVWLAREGHVRIASDQGLLAHWVHRRDRAMEDVLSRPDVAPVVADTLYRVICGRSARPAEIAAAVPRLTNADDLAQLASELRDSDDGARVLVHEVVPALRTYLTRRIESEPAQGGRLVFLHFMKVGGTSLSDFFTSWFPPQQARMHVYVDELVLTPAPVLAGLQLIAGHIPYHALAVVPGPFTTVTVLRDPVSRTISHYSTLKATEPAFADLTLDRFVDDRDFDALVRNYQARQLAHDVSLSRAWIDFAPERELAARGVTGYVRYPLASLFDADPLGPDDDALLGAAAANLASLDVVGTTDDLDQVVALTASRLGRSVAARVPRLNRSTPLAADSVSDALLKRIEAKTEVDRELWRLAKVRAGGEPAADRSLPTS